jgi:hypothetical protein
LADSPAFRGWAANLHRGYPYFPVTKTSCIKRGYEESGEEDLEFCGFGSQITKLQKTLFKTVTIQSAVFEYFRQFNALRIASPHLSHQSGGPENPGATCILAKQQLRQRTEVLFFSCFRDAPANSETAGIQTLRGWRQKL